MTDKYHQHKMFGAQTIARSLVVVAPRVQTLTIPFQHLKGFVVSDTALTLQYIAPTVSAAAAAATANTSVVAATPNTAPLHPRMDQPAPDMWAIEELLADK